MSSSIIQQAVQDFNKECDARKMQALIDDNLRISKELDRLTGIVNQWYENK